jgi:hypothetical protein
MSTDKKITRYYKDKSSVGNGKAMAFFLNRPSKYERKRAEIKKKRGGGGWGMFGLPDVFTTFPYSFLTVVSLAA